MKQEWSFKWRFQDFEDGVSCPCEDRIIEKRLLENLPCSLGNLMQSTIMGQVNLQISSDHMLKISSIIGWYLTSWAQAGHKTQWVSLVSSKDVTCIKPAIKN